MTNKNDNLGWFQCNQRGNGFRITREEIDCGDHVDRQACDHCYGGIMTVDFTYPDGPGWVFKETEPDNATVEELGRDPDGKVSSLPVIKTGNSRGRRKAEKGGVWIDVGGYCYEASQEVKGASVGWIKAIKRLGHRVGSLDCDGTVNIYIFNENGKGKL